MKKFLTIILLSLIFSSHLSAHPHVFINYQLNFIFDQNRLNGIKLKWEFDEFFSNSVIQDFDKDHNNSFSMTEIKQIQRQAFANLKNSEYFCHFKLNGKTFSIRQVSDFYAVIDKHHLIYVFFIPWGTQVKSTVQEVRVVLYDPNYYINVSPQKLKTVNFTNPSAFTTTYRIRTYKGKIPDAIQSLPEEIVVKFKK